MQTTTKRWKKEVRPSFDSTFFSFLFLSDHHHHHIEEGGGAQQKRKGGNPFYFCCVVFCPSSRMIPHPPRALPFFLSATALLFLSSLFVVLRSRGANNALRSEDLKEAEKKKKGGLGFKRNSFFFFSLTSHRTKPFPLSCQFFAFA